MEIRVHLQKCISIIFEMLYTKQKLTITPICMKKGIVKILFFLSIASTAGFILSGYGYQWGIWGLGPAFSLLRYGAYASVGFLTIQVVLYFFVKNDDFTLKAMVLAGVILTFGVTATGVYWQYKAQSVPAIHDITTDLESPPEFVDMVRLRQDAPNPAEYAGEETANQQRQAYPDIQPLIVDTGKQEVMDEIITLIQEREWTPVGIDRQEGRIEATETLAWFGFSDDVVFRVSETGEGTRIDMRSKSRIGRSDVGVNAERIDAFLADLQNRLE